jgi:hypothetical protein
MTQSTPQREWTVAQASDSSGFKLPAPGSGSGSPPATGGAGSAQSDGFGTVPMQLGPSSKDALIGAAALLAVAVLVLFVRKAFVSSLVAKRFSPRQASMAGWWLFLLLLSVATVVVFTIIGANWFFTPIYAGPPGLLAVVALIGLLISSMKKG